MSKIESLPDMHWSPAAAMGSVMEEIDDITEMLIIYRTKSGDGQHSRSANMTNKDVLWMLELEKLRTLE